MLHVKEEGLQVKEVLQVKEEGLEVLAMIRSSLSTFDNKYNFLKDFS